MEFTLTYRGPLKANRGATDKQAIRRVFHTQMRQLWTQAPLSAYTALLSKTNRPSQPCLLEDLGPFHFAPLISSRLNLIAELAITMLRPEPPGSIVTQGGDIDNRIKTLLDALRMPRVLAELSKGDTPSEGEDPFFCLLQDDNLVTKLAVSTDRLLEPVDSQSEVQLLIHVTVKQTQGTWDNLGLA